MNSDMSTRSLKCGSSGGIRQSHNQTNNQQCIEGPAQWGGTTRVVEYWEDFQLPTNMASTLCGFRFGAWPLHVAIRVTSGYSTNKQGLVKSWDVRGENSCCAEGCQEAIVPGGSREAEVMGPTGMLGI